MSELVRKLTNEARELTADERQELIDNLLALDPALEEKFEQEWSGEIRRRIEELMKGDIAPRSYAEVMDGLRSVRQR